MTYKCNPALILLRQEDWHSFESSVGYVVLKDEAIASKRKKKKRPAKEVRVHGAPRVIICVWVFSLHVCLCMPGIQ